MKKPDISHDGDTLIFSYKEPGVTIAYSHIKRVRDGISSEVTIQVLDQYLHWGSLNLSSTQTRDRLASSLIKRSDVLDWDVALTQTCFMASQELRKGQPPIDLSTLPDPGPPSYVIYPLIPKDETSMIFADGASGKSYIAVWLATSAYWSLDLPFPIRVKEKADVLYLDWETTEERIRYRLGRVAKGFQVALPKIRYRRLWMPLADQIESIRSQSSDQTLTIIDSLGPACGGDPNDGQLAMETMNALRSLPGTHVLLHHLSHESAKSNGRVHPMGSRYYRNLSRRSWLIRKSEDSPDGDLPLGIWQDKSNDDQPFTAPIGIKVSFDGNEGPVVFASHSLEEDPSLNHHLALPMRIRHLLKRGRLSTGEIAEALEVEPEVLGRTLRRMKDVVQIATGGGRGKQSVWGLSA